MKTTIIWVVLIFILTFISAFLTFLIMYFINKNKINKEKNLQEKKEKNSIEKLRTIKANYRKNIEEEKEKFYRKIENKELEIKKRKNELKLEEKEIEKEYLKIKKNKKDMIQYEKTIMEKEIIYNQKMNILLKDIESKANLTKEEAKDIIFKNILEENELLLNQKLKEQKLRFELNIKEHTTNLIVNSIEKFASKTINEKTTKYLKLPNDEIKGRIIGKEGRNIKCFEAYAGVDLLIDEKPNVVTVSSFDPIRREIAIISLQKLIDSGKIQPIRIEETIDETRKEIEDIIQESGKKILEELNIYDFEPKLVNIIGRLKYRTSYNQNALLHSIETAKIAFNIAKELGLNAKLALKAGLLHDVGKAVDFEENDSHVNLGVKIAKQFKLDPIIINAIESHHGDVKPNNNYSIIVAAADTISASRPGARKNSLEDYITKIKELEDICMSIDGVIKAYAFQSGRKIRVIVNHKKVDDNKIDLIALKINQKIKNNKRIPGDIDVHVIREYHKYTKIK